MIVITIFVRSLLHPRNWTKYFTYVISLILYKNYKRQKLLLSSQSIERFRDQTRVTELVSRWNRDLNPAMSGCRACLHNLPTKGLPKLHETGLGVSSAGRILWPNAASRLKEVDAFLYFCLFFLEKTDHPLIWKGQKKVPETPFKKKQNSDITCIGNTGNKICILVIGLKEIMCSSLWQ